MKKLFTLGADPEFILENFNEELVCAGDYLSYDGAFGCDGHSAIAEIRPGTSTSPVELTCKIWKILKSGPSDIYNYKWKAGSYLHGEPIGGHIHFGVSHTNQLVRNLDLTILALSNIFDNKDQVEKRNNTSYGGPGGYDRKDYGFEYRSAGSYLINPALTLIHFTIGKLTILATDKTGELNSEDKMRDPKHFVTNFYKVLDKIPDDCVAGLNILQEVLHKKIDWAIDIKKTWAI